MTQNFCGVIFLADDRSLKNTFRWRYFGGEAVTEFALLFKVETFEGKFWQLLANPLKYSPYKIFLPYGIFLLKKFHSRNSCADIVCLPASPVLYAYGVLVPQVLFLILQKGDIDGYFKKYQG